MRTIPKFGIMAPEDEIACRQMLHTAYLYVGATTVRYPRGNGLGVEIQQKMVEIPIGQAEIVASFNGQYDEYISVLAFGSRVQAAVDAAEAFSMKHEIGVRVVNMRFVKPLDTQMLDDL